MLKVHDRRTFLAFLVGAAAVVVVLNYVSRDLFFRLDLTDSQIYSLSGSSKAVIGKLDDRLIMKVYFTENLPGQYGNNRRYLQDLLEEYEAYSDGKIRFEIYKPETDDALIQEARRYGIQPVQLQVIENDKLEVKRVFMGMVFLYGDARATLPVIQTTTGLEYDITKEMKRLVEKDKRTIALATVDDGEAGAQNIRDVLGQSYNVRTVDLGADVPEDVQLLLFGGVEDSLSSEALTNLRTFVDRGGNLFVAQSRIKADLQTQVGRPVASNIFDFLEGLGFTLKENLVLDQRCSHITVTQQRGIFRLNSQVQYPFFPLIQSFGDHLTVEGLEQVRLLFSSEIATNGSDSLSNAVTPLFVTSDRSGVVSESYNLRPVENPSFRGMNQPGKVVAALSTVTSSTTSNVSRVILVSDSYFFDDSGGGGFEENFVFIANAVDFLMGDSGLVALRSREITTRPLAELGDAERASWKWVNILLPPILVVGYGMFRWRRELARSRYLEALYG
jgi:gliding-associated putative ABC transporter substrate-binding component GldG